MHKQGVGLHPRNTAKPFSRDIRCNGTYTMDGSVTYGQPHSQAVHAHQWDSEGFDGPALSFTTLEKVARRFATTNGQEDGVVYAVTVAALTAEGCALEDPRRHSAGLQNPNENEIIVVPPADGVTIDLMRVTEVYT
jgi:hypothetical protein